MTRSPNNKPCIFSAAGWTDGVSRLCQNGGDSAEPPDEAEEGFRDHFLALILLAVLEFLLRRGLWSGLPQAVQSLHWIGVDLVSRIFSVENGLHRMKTKNKTKQNQIKSLWVFRTGFFLRLLPPGVVPPVPFGSGRRPENFFWGPFLMNFFDSYFFTPWVNPGRTP